MLAVTQASPVLQTGEEDPCQQVLFAVGTILSGKEEGKKKQKQKQGQISVNAHNDPSLHFMGRGRQNQKSQVI